MLSPRSYTREDVVELQCHGSEVCLNRVLRACLGAGASSAEPGLFSQTTLVLLISNTIEILTFDTCFLLVLESFKW